MIKQVGKKRFTINAMHEMNPAMVDIKLVRVYLESNCRPLLLNFDRS